MSMVGLFTVPPQAVTASAPSADAGAAEGFGNLLQGALDALAQDAAGAEAEASTSDAALVEAPASTSSASEVAPVEATLPLVELVETPKGPLVELVETPASTSSASGVESAEDAAS